MTKDVFDDCKNLVSHDRQLFKDNTPPTNTLLIYGSNENRLGYSKNQMIAAKKRIGENCELIIIPNADHNLNLKRKSGKIGFENLPELKEKILKHYSS